MVKEKSQRSLRKIFIIVFLSFVYNCNLYSTGIVYLWMVESDFVDFANKGTSTGHYAHEIRDSLKRLGYTPVWTTQLYGLKSFDKIIFHSSYSLTDKFAPSNYPKEKIVALMWEPPSILPGDYDPAYQKQFSRVYTWDDSLVDNISRFHFYYPFCFPMIEKTVSFREKKLCVMVNANKDFYHRHALYGERRRVIQFYEHNHFGDFDLYGYGWENSRLRNYKGSIKSKVDYVKQYKFCYAYENMHNIKGYITEKLFDVFKAGSVPIYWGADNVTDYVPKNCFIDRRDFLSDEQLYNFLKNMDEGTYNGYVENIKLFLNGPRALIFSTEYFVDIVLDSVEPGYDKKIALTNDYRLKLASLYCYLGKKVDF